MAEKVAAERRLERKKNISATLTATEKQSRQFRSPCNCSCSVYFLLRAPPKKTLYPPLEGNCYLRMVNLVIITRRLISPRFFHHHWYLSLCCLVVYRVIQVFVETLCIQFFFYIYILLYTHVTLCACALYAIDKLQSFRFKLGEKCWSIVRFVFVSRSFRFISNRSCKCGLFQIRVADWFKFYMPVEHREAFCTLWLFILPKKIKKNSVRILYVFIYLLLGVSLIQMVQLIYKIRHVTHSFMLLTRTWKFRLITFWTRFPLFDLC